MIKAITAIAAAALVATLIVVLPGIAPEVSANTPTEAGVQQVAAKGDRLAIHPIGETCSKRAWPYYEDACLFESRWQGENRKVRIVTTDRLDPTVR